MNEIILNIYLVINNGLVQEFRVVSYEMEGGDDRKIEFLKTQAKEDYPKAIIFDAPSDDLQEGCCGLCLVLLFRVKNQ